MRRPRRPKSRLTFETLEPRDVPAVTGLVFVDLNQDGTQDVDDVGVAGVTVTATDDTGATQTVTTQDDGSYQLDTDARNVRIEFSGFPEGTTPGRVVRTSGPVVRFLDAQSDRTEVNLSLASPRLVTTQFYYDHARTGANSWQGAVLAFPYGSQDFATPTPLANVSDVGSVWGLAYQPSSNTVYASAFLKRHAGFGPNAAGTGVTTGGIYRIDAAAEEPAATLLVDLNATGFDTGANPHPTQSEENGGDWFHDANGVALIGKRSLGGLQASADGSALYTVNLNTRELVTIPLKPDGSRDASRPITSVPVPLTNPAGSGIANFAAANVRPFAVALKGNAVFVGVTYTAETTQTASDLRAFVYAYDPAQKAFRNYDQRTGTFATSGAVTPVLTANLTYPRGLADDPTPGEPGDEVSAAWRPWTSTFETAIGDDGIVAHPQPWLTDIVFDGDAMVLGLRDRFGDQAGFMTGSTDPDDEMLYTAVAVGDILRAAPNGSGGWQLESGAKAGSLGTDGATTGQGPGGGEFYYQDAADGGPDEVATGALAQVPGFRTVAATGNDPAGQFDGGVYEFFNSDSAAGTKAAGTTAAKAEVYATFDSSTFGSANGLGDLEALPTSGTVEVGDRVFQDTNANGRQDAGEPGLARVKLQLFRGDTQVATTTTDSDGNFLFTGLTPSTAYSIRIDTTQSALAGRSLASADRGDSDGLDSDATLTGTTATVAFTSPLEGTSDHSLDVGFGAAAPPPALATLSGRVILDFDNSGTANGPDSGLAGVTVSLIGGRLAVPLTVTTDAQGNFRFTDLEAGTYTLTETQPTSPATQTGKDTAGSAGGSAAAANSIANIVVTAGQVATGYTFAEIPLVSTAGTVFDDTNANGTKDTGEPGIAGVTVTLTGTSVVSGAIAPKTAVTDASGSYMFADLTPGTYALTETQPNGYLDGNDQNGSPAGTVSNDAFAGINLTTASGSGFNFAELKPASLGGAVFTDANNDGARAPTGEPGIPGVMVRVTGTDDRGQAVSQTATTGPDGSYSFANLRPGTYELNEAQPPGFTDGKDAAGTAGGTAAATGDQVQGIQLAAGASAAGYLFGERAAAPDPADLGLTVSSASPSITAGGTVTLTFTLRNAGPATATAATVQLDYGGLEFVSPPSAAFNGTTRTWTVGDLAAGATQTLQVVLRAAAAGAFHPSATATTTAPETATADNSVTATITAVAPPPVTPPPPDRPPPQPRPRPPAPRPAVRRWFLSSGTHARRV